MTLEALVAARAELPLGEARFIRPSEAKSLLLLCEQDGYVKIDIPEVLPVVRGRLGWLLDEAIERSLELRGACGSGIGASSSLESTLTDQLYRARLIGARGLTIAMPTLEGITNRSGALDADDCATLRWWIGSSRHRPLRLYLDVADCMLGAYLEPITLTHLMHAATQTSSAASPPLVVEWVDSLETLDASPISDVVASARGSVPDESLLVEPSPPPPISAPIDADAIVAIGNAEVDNGDATLTPLAAPATGDLVLSSSPSHRRTSIESDAAWPLDDTPGSRDEILPIAHPATIPAPEPPSGEATRAAEREPCNLPLHVDAPNAWRSWMQRLDTARGPKPLNAIEQLFINAYVPLSDAYHRGIAGAECRSVLDHWASSFGESYTEAFDALRLRGRRPTMVLDIPEAAQRLARLHGARSVQLVLVDGMRFDLGLRVQARLVTELGRQATFMDRFLLWSALPTTTAQQLELISRGPEGLRDGDIHSEMPVLAARGRSASTLRRVRAGNRELLKLDLVEARLSEPGSPLTERLDQLGAEVSDALSAALGRLAPRTLVVVFGDHGFCLDATETGTSPMRQGGASPDEVLVPGFAWLIGQTH